MTGETPDPLVLSGPIAGALGTIATDEGGGETRRPLFGPSSAFAAFLAAEAMDDPPLPWIIRGVLPRVGMTMIYADPKTGKSLVALDLAAVMIGGFRFMGEIQSEEVDYVVYMSGEGRSGMGGRLHGLTRAHPDLDREQLRTRVILTGKVVKLGAESGDLSVEEFAEWASQLIAQAPPRADGTPARVVFILDTWANAAQGIDSNQTQEVGDAMNRLNDLAQSVRLCVLVIHHSNKGGGFMGSQAFYASVDLLFEAKKTDEGGTLHLVGGKDTGGFTPRGYGIVVEDLSYLGRDGQDYTTSAAWIKWSGAVRVETKPTSKTETAFTDALAYLRGNDMRTPETGIELNDLAKAIHASPSTLRDGMNRAKSSGEERIRVKPANREKTEGGHPVKRTVPVYFSPFLGED